MDEYTRGFLDGAKAGVEIAEQIFEQSAEQDAKHEEECQAVDISLDDIPNDFQKWCNKIIEENETK